MSENQQNEIHNETQNETTLISLTHVSGIFFGFIVPLVMFLVKKDGSDYMKTQVKEALNFQITIAIILIGTSFVLNFLSLFTTPVILIADIILCIQAAVAVSNGKDYRYPFALRLIK